MLSAAGQALGSAIGGLFGGDSYKRYLNEAKNLMEQRTSLNEKYMGLELDLSQRDRTTLIGQIRNQLNFDQSRNQLGFYDPSVNNQLEYDEEYDPVSRLQQLRENANGNMKKLIRSGVASREELIKYLNKLNKREKNRDLIKELMQYETADLSILAN